MAGLLTQAAAGQGISESSEGTVPLLHATLSPAIRSGPDPCKGENNEDDEEEAEEEDESETAGGGVVSTETGQNRFAERSSTFCAEEDVNKDDN